MSPGLRLDRSLLTVRVLLSGFLALALTACWRQANATPANKAALERHYDRFLSKDLARCTTCHLPSDNKTPENLRDFPHNQFGDRLRQLGEQLGSKGSHPDLETRLTAIAQEDSDGDGIANELELLLGTNPGDPENKPTETALAAADKIQAEYAKFYAGYHWRPFDPVVRPVVPPVPNPRWVRNPIDAFISAEHSSHQLSPRPDATRDVLLRRVYLDLIGLTPTPQEQDAFLRDSSANAYEKLVDRLLDDPRHGERWARHWMDVWRYSDWAGWTDGGQVRDSKPHIWRWRDWIVESLNQDKPYDRMVLEMLAADELAPEDTNALRATGFLVRNYKMLSREQWLEDTIKHTGQAFLGITVGCAKCHDHMMDPITQREYYRMRAIFEPHQVRTDRIPGQTNTALDGLVRVFDADPKTPTWLFVRGDERHPDTNKVIEPGVPSFLRGAFAVKPVHLPASAVQPDKRDFVIRDQMAAADRAVTEARETLKRLQTNTAAEPAKQQEQLLLITLAEARRAELQSTIQAEQVEESGGKQTEAWTNAALAASTAQLRLAIEEANYKQFSADQARELAEKKLADAESKKASTENANKELAAAKKKCEEAANTLAKAKSNQVAGPLVKLRPRPVEVFPAESTGRRLAFARWVTAQENPLTARVAMNHIWLRHFGRGLVPTPSDFGRNGRSPSHPQLLDWLAAEFMAHNWDMKAMHRMIVTSSAYRMASTPDEGNLQIDPENVYLWRMNSRRLEAEAVRDNLLQVTGNLDLTRGGPDIDHKLGLTSKRRSLYLRIAAEKEVEFLKIFDGPSVTECYQRRPSVVPQQALALANSQLTLEQAHLLTETLAREAGQNNRQFILDAYRRVLARRPRREETQACLDYLSHHAQRPRENLVLVLLNHNDFVTLR